jgi:hypothetical protein
MIAGIVGLNPAEGMDVLVCSRCVVYVAASATSCSLVQMSPIECGDTRWCIWLRHCPTSRKVAGSIGILYCSHPSGRSTALQSTHKWVPGFFPRGTGDRFVELTTLPPPCADCLEIWEPEALGTLRVYPGLYRNCFTYRFCVSNCAWTRNLKH